MSEAGPAPANVDADLKSAKALRFDVSPTSSGVRASVRGAF
jgi:hypothetical protein